MDEKAGQTGIARFIVKWGAVVGFVGGLIGITGGGLSLFDRFYPPSVEILELTPVYISEPKTVLAANSAIRGVGVLLHVRAGNRPVTLTGLELGGKRCISMNEFYGFMEVDGKTDQDIEAEFNRLRPFQQVSFFGWPTDRSGPISLAPWEESYVRFTFLEPGIGSSPDLLIDRRFLGSVQEPFPMIRRFGFNVLEMFTLMPSDKTSWTAGHLRNEIFDGVLAFRILAGGTQITIPTNALRAPKRLAPDAWVKGDLAPMLAEQMPNPDLEPTENRSINCYFQTHKASRVVPTNTANGTDKKG